MLDQSNGMMRKNRVYRKDHYNKMGYKILYGKSAKAIKSYNGNFMTVREILWF